ncbi:hypothetical protein, partial [Turicimonas muris]
EKMQVTMGLEPMTTPARISQKGNVPNSPVFKEFFKLKPSAKNKTRQLKNISSTLTLGINSQNPSDSLCSVSMK